MDDQDPSIQELARAIADQLAPYMQPPDPNQLFDHTDLARLFKVSRSTIFQRAKAENWPRTRFGTDAKSDRFSRADIEQIQALKHQQPKPEKTIPNVGTRANKNRNKK